MPRCAWGLYVAMGVGASDPLADMPRKTYTGDFTQALRDEPERSTASPDGVGVAMLQLESQMRKAEF